MKVNDIMPITEAIVNVPKHWIKQISEVYKQPLIYAYATEFTDSLTDKQELLSELNFNPMGGIERIADVVSSKNKLIIMVTNLELKDKHDETFIGDTTVTLVAQYAPNSNSKGGYSKHVNYGNLLIINLAAFIANGEDLESPNQEINDMIRSMESVIEHEMVHLIQNTKGNSNQLKKNKGYELQAVGKYKEYFKSPVEFNAMITTFIRDMEQKLSNLSQEEKSILGYDNIMNGIKYSLGHTYAYKKTGNKNIDTKAFRIYANNTFEQSPFMLTLMKEKPKSWKRAVKTIMKHFQDTL